MVETQDAKSGLPLTGFGSVLYALLAENGIRTLSELSRRLGERYTRQQLASYANGTRRVPPALPRLILESLGLDADGRARLADAVAFGQPDERVMYPNEIKRAEEAA